MDEPVFKRLKTKEEENLELNDNILSINDLPDDIKKHSTSFFSRKTLNNVMQISRHWQMITKNAYINHLRSLTAEEFNEEFAKSVFSNNYFIFNIFKEIVTTEQGWPKLIFNWLFDSGLKKIEHFRNIDYCGVSLLYAAIEYCNNNIAMYLIEQMASTANDAEYKFIEKGGKGGTGGKGRRLYGAYWSDNEECTANDAVYRFENNIIRKSDVRKRILKGQRSRLFDKWSRTWANSWINIGYSIGKDRGVYITPLLKAILIGNEYIAKILLQKGARIPIRLNYARLNSASDSDDSDYTNDEIEIMGALEIERVLIHEMHIEEMEIKNKALAETLLENEKLKASKLENNPIDSENNMNLR